MEHAPNVRKEIFARDTRNSWCCREMVEVVAQLDEVSSDREVLDAV